MSIIFLEDRLEAVNTDHIIRYCQQAEDIDQLTVSTHKLLAELAHTYNPEDSYTHNQVLFEGTEAECVYRFKNLMNMIASDKPIIRYKKSVGTTLGIQEFVDAHCKNVRGSVVSVGLMRQIFTGYYSGSFSQGPVDVADGYQHRPYGYDSEKLDGPNTLQFIKWIKEAAKKAGYNVDTLYENGYFYAYERYDGEAIDLDKVFFTHIEIIGKPSEEIPEEIAKQVAHL